MGEFRMPSLGSDMEDGVLVEWLVAPGDKVSRGDVVAAVETQKGAIEIEIFEDGVVQSLEAEIGERLPVGAVMAVIGAAPGTADAGAPAPAADRAPAPPKRPSRADGSTSDAALPDAPAAVAPPPRPPAARTGAATPAARVLAAEHDIDLGGISGSWPGGGIVRADVEARLDSGPAIRSGATKIEAMRAAIAAAMTRSKHEIPHYYMTHRIDLQPATDWLAARNAGLDPAARLLMGALVVKATAMAAQAVKGMNGRFDAGSFEPSTAVNAGVAVALRGGGLVAPAIPSADGLTLDEVMGAMRDLVTRARAGRLRNSEMTSGTITVSSLGERGVDEMTGVIYPPQVALVAFGSPRAEARVVADDRIAARQTVSVTLAADHRASDGRRGARFLSEIERLLQAPEAL